MKRNEWEEFFDEYAPLYMHNSFTKNTTKEIDFVLEELQISPGSYILDIGCGTGRHAIELARRGYMVTGVDISSGMLNEAKKAARTVGVEVEWIHDDATQFASTKLFDAAICLCEGSFGLVGKHGDPIEHPLSILRRICKAIKTNGKAILTVGNGYASIRKYTQEDVAEGKFDPLTMAEVYTEEYDTASGKKSKLLRERGFIPTELVMLFSQAGFKVEHIWGGTAGNWGRREINLDEIEIMVVACKMGKAA